MNLKFGLLGFLYYEPATGYELTKKFFKPLRPIRNVVYRHLNTMLEEGLVEVDRVEQEKFPTKNVFHITKKGREALRGWLVTYKDENFANDGIGAILWYSAVADKQDIIDLLNQFLRLAKQEYRYYQEQNQKHLKYRKDSYSELDYMYKSLVYDFALSRWRETISFVEKAIRTITDFNETNTNKPEVGRASTPGRRHRGKMKGGDGSKATGDEVSKVRKILPVSRNH